MKRKINNGIFYVVIALVSILAIGTVAYAYSVSQNVNVSGDYNYYEAEVQPTEGVTFGAFSGPDIYSNLNIYGHVTEGSSMAWSTTTRDVTGHVLTFQQLNDYQFMDIINGTQADNLSFAMPATSTMMQILPKVGSTRTWTIHNATTTDATTFTLTTGAGMDLVGTANTADVIGGNAYMDVTCTQIPYISTTNENIVCKLLEHVAAD